MKKALLLLLLSSSLMIAQTTCESKEETFEDLNSITKCSIESSKSGSAKNTRQISVKISAPKTRYLKKRIAPKKMEVKSVESLSTSGISSTSHSTDISNSLAIKENKSINSIALLSNTISAEEVKKAVKFHDISDIPTFDACSKEKGNKKLGCFNTQMSKHIEKHFVYPQDAVINKVEGKVWVRFIIDKNGVVSNIKTLGPKGAKILNDEAERVVSKLPKFAPGKKDGKKVSVKYGFPITFSLEQ